MSSLQRALQSRSTGTVKTSTFKSRSTGTVTTSGGTGAFETSFAQGLDLSELLGGDSTNRRGSAAEELLKIKQEERRQREIQAEEEEKMQQALRKRIHSLKENTSKPSKRSSFEIGDALVRMHGTDEKTASILSRKQTVRRMGTLVTSRRNSAPRRKSGTKAEKSLASKKSRKSKF